MGSGTHFVYQNIQYMLKRQTQSSKQTARKLARKKAQKRKRLRNNEGVDSRNQKYMEDVSHCFHGFGMLHEYTAEHLRMSLKITQGYKENDGFEFVHEEKGMVIYMKRGDVRIAVVHSNVLLHDSWVIAHSSQFEKLRQRFSSSEAFEFVSKSDNGRGEKCAKYTHIHTRVIVRIVCRKRQIFPGIRSR